MTPILVYDKTKSKSIKDNPKIVLMSKQSTQRNNIETIYAGFKTKAPLKTQSKSSKKGPGDQLSLKATLNQTFLKKKGGAH